MRTKIVRVKETITDAELYHILQTLQYWNKCNPDSKLVPMNTQLSDKLEQLLYSTISADNYQIFTEVEE